MKIQRYLVPDKVKFTTSGILPKKEPEMQRSRNVWPIIRSGRKGNKGHENTFVGVRFVYYHNGNDSLGLVDTYTGQILLNCTLYVQFTTIC